MVARHETPIQAPSPASAEVPPAPPTGPRLVLVLRCAHCPPTQASIVVCGGCGEPLAEPLDRPFDLAASAGVDVMTLVHDLVDALLRQQKGAA
jgi:hypothetical protein